MLKYIKEYYFRRFARKTDPAMMSWLKGLEEQGRYILIIL